MNKLTKFILAIALQVIIIFAIIIPKLFILIGGTEILLKITPVDPTSPLRGDYATFQYDISNLDSAFLNNHLTTGTLVRNSDTIYIILIQSGKYWIAQSASLNKPAGNNQIFIKGKVASGGIESRTNNLASQQTANSRLHIVYGIEEYFIPEGTGRNFSFLNKEAAASVAVDGNGNAAVKKIYVDGKPWPNNDKSAQRSPVPNSAYPTATRSALSVSPNPVKSARVEVSSVNVDAEKSSYSDNQYLVDTICPSNYNVRNIRCVPEDKDRNDISLTGYLTNAHQPNQYGAFCSFTADRPFKVSIYAICDNEILLTRDYTQKELAADIGYTIPTRFNLWNHQQVLAKENGQATLSLQCPVGYTITNYACGPFGSNQQGVKFLKVNNTADKNGPISECVFEAKQQFEGIARAICEKTN